MQEFDRIKDLIYDELNELSRVDRLSKEVVCLIGELVDILKDVGTIEMFEESGYAPSDEYSLANSYSAGGSSRRYYMGNSYGDNRGGYGYARRSGRGYSRADGKEHMIEKLEHLMNEAQNDTDRAAIKNLIDQMDKG